MDSSKLADRLAAIEDELKQIRHCLLLLISTAFSESRSCDNKRCYAVLERHWNLKSHEDWVQCKCVFANRDDAIAFLNASSDENDMVIDDTGEKAYMEDWCNAGHTLKVIECDYYDGTHKNMFSG